MAKEKVKLVVKEDVYDYKKGQVIEVEERLARLNIQSGWCELESTKKTKATTKDEIKA
jgi:hypothetical protein